MKRWIQASARADLNQVRRPQGRGYIGASPIWIDTMEGPDYYAKQVRKGLLVVHNEADENPRIAAAPPEEPEPEVEDEGTPDQDEDPAEDEEEDPDEDIEEPE